MGALSHAATNAAVGSTGVQLRSRRRHQQRHAPPQSSSLSLPPPPPASGGGSLRSRDAVGGRPKWSRVLLKVSGEALGGPESSQGIDPETIQRISAEIATVVETGIEVAVVVGGGNYFRGKAMASAGLDRASADYVGMLATVMNAITLQAGLESRGIPTRVQTAIEMKEVAEPYIRRKAIRHLELGRVVIFGAGTGNPFFTTDTAAALRAAEIDAQAVLKATNVDGIFDSDPRTNSDANLLTRLTYRRVSMEGLSVMDATAITLCEENDLPVVVFNLRNTGNISRALMGEEVGSLVASKEYLGQL